ncbi:MAG: InlB B-repeat-containing protein [Treponema sp.]|nr:InlB B-repeat-containing protein [Candidatus Treponema equifaecale]
MMFRRVMQSVKVLLTQNALLWRGGMTLLLLNLVLCFASCDGEMNMFGDLKESVFEDTSSSISFFADSNLSTKLMEKKYKLGTVITSSVLTGDCLETIQKYKPGYAVKSWKHSEFPKESGFTTKALKEKGYLVLDESENISYIKLSMAGGIVYISEFEARKDTPYSLYSYFENAADDEFTRDEDSKTLFTGTTGELTDVSPDQLPTREGFEKPASIEQKTIEGDGSTEIYAYYKRNRVAVKYKYINSDGSEDTRELKGKYGAILSLEYNELLGKKFDSWGIQTGDDVYPIAEPKTFPAENAIYVPLYALLSYKISYELNGGTVNEKNPSSFTVVDNVDLNSPVRNGWTFEGWYENADFSGNKVDGWKAGERYAETVLYAKWKFDAIDVPGVDITLPTETDQNISVSAALNSEKTQISAFVKGNDGKVDSSYSSYVWIFNGKLLNASSAEVTVDVNDIGAGVYELLVVVTTSEGKQYAGIESIEIKK